MATRQGQRRVRYQGRAVSLGPDAIATLPCSPGVYLFSDEPGHLLYVGKSVNLRDRVRSYFRKGGGHTRRTERLKREVQHIEVYHTGSELEALLLESRLIKERQPIYNVRGRRYEHYPFLKLTAERYPRLMVTRVLEEDGSRYFGPFHSASYLTEALEHLQPVFGLRTCSVLPERPCLQLDLARCAGPCTGRVDAAYADGVRQLEAVLKGDPGDLVTRMRAEMTAASESFEFERAARLRDRLRALTGLMEHQARLSAADGFDYLVVLPAHPGPAATFLAIRRARWVGQLTLSEAEISDRTASAKLRAFLKQSFVTAAPPGSRIGRAELDEVQIVGSWLYRRRHQPGVLAIASDTLPDHARAAVSVARGLIAPS